MQADFDHYKKTFHCDSVQRSRQSIGQMQCNHIHSIYRTLLNVNPRIHLEKSGHNTLYPAGTDPNQLNEAQLNDVQKPNTELSL
jgi:hypothetical protein